MLVKCFTIYILTFQNLGLEYLVCSDLCHQSFSFPEKSLCKDHTSERKNKYMRHTQKFHQSKDVKCDAYWTIKIFYLWIGYILTMPLLSLGCRSMQRMMWILTRHSWGQLSGSSLNCRGGSETFGSSDKGYTRNDPCECRSSSKIILVSPMSTTRWQPNIIHTLTTTLLFWSSSFTHFSHCLECPESQNLKRCF